MVENTQFHPGKVVSRPEVGATVEILEVKIFDPQKMTISGLVAEF